MTTIQSRLTMLREDPYYTHWTPIVCPTEV